MPKYLLWHYTNDITFSEFIIQAAYIDPSRILILRVPRSTFWIRRAADLSFIYPLNLLHNADFAKC